jgi:hypothetical protein
MPSLEFGHRTGHVEFLDYDQGMAEGLGARFDDEKNQYFLPLTDADGHNIFIEPPGSDAPAPIEKALVIYKQAEPIRTEFDLPCVLIIRDDAQPSQQREWSAPPVQYRLPADGAVQISANGDLGWSAYESKLREHQWDFTYTIECWSRSRTVAQMLLQMVLIRYPLYGKVKVVDSVGNERIYHTFLEGTADLTEINSLVDRVCGFSATVRVEGELTLDRVPVISSPFTGELVPYDPNDPTSPFNPGDPTDPDNPGDPDPGPGGYWADGQPIKRVTVIGSNE